MKLWKNGHFHSMRTPEAEFFNLVTEQGKIIAINVNEQDYAAIDTIDLGGHHVYPGLVDAHLHLIGYGQKRSRIDLSTRINKQDIINYLVTIKKSDLLVAEGYRQCGLTKFDLNLINQGDPVLLIHNDYHTVTVNSQALRQAGMDSDTGILTERDSELIKEKLLVYDEPVLEGYFRAAVSHLHTLGLTGGHSDDLFYFHSFTKTLNAINNVLEDLPFRTHLLIHHRIFNEFLESQTPTKCHAPYLEFGAVKTFYDGTLSSKTALVSQPYLNTTSNGTRLFTLPEFKLLLGEIRRHHFPIAIHVIGDQGLDEVADWLTALPPLPGQRDRLIHASLAKNTTLDKLTKLPVVLDIQPSFVTSDLPHFHEWFSSFPENIYPWKSYLDHGLSLLGSSDAPVEDPNPMLGIHALITRKSPQGGTIYQPQERIDRFSAVKMYTTNHAIISQATAYRGYLDIGYLADFSIFPADLLSVREESLLSLPVTMTVIDEKIVFNGNIK